MKKIKILMLGIAAASLLMVSAPMADAGYHKNPCAAKNPCNPCAGKNPCAAKNPCNPCAAKNPCKVKNPCNPCAKK